MAQALVQRPSAGPAKLTLSSDLLARLETLLSTLVEEYQRLCTELDEYRSALAQADQPRLTAALANNQARAARLAELEAHRSLLMRSIASVRPGQAIPELSTSQVAAQAPEPVRSRLLNLAGKLRPIIARADEQQRIARLATQSLLAHTTGVMQQIQRQLSQTGTYTRGARPAAAASPVVSALDLTT